MIFYYLDASAWIKRYYQESGTVWMQKFFAENESKACASLGVIEVISTLARKKKAREIIPTIFEQKILEVETDWMRFIQIKAPSIINNNAAPTQSTKKPHQF